MDFLNRKNRVLKNIYKKLIIKLKKMENEIILAYPKIEEKVNIVDDCTIIYNGKVFEDIITIME
jgi:ABC-type lipopolysaccharide export system ATPase subunit